MENLQAEYLREMLAQGQQNDNFDAEGDGDADADDVEADVDADVDGDGDGDGDDEDVDPSDRDVDGTLDGGVAASSEEGSTTQRKSSECDLLLYFCCTEQIDTAPNNPILRPGVTVSIGLDKNTKLTAVFTRYVEFCNEQSSNRRQVVSLDDLEFIHCQLLNKNDTAEASALMKNDKIRVRKNRSAERKAQEERRRMEREMDREYFKQLRHLLDPGRGKTADMILDCRGKHVDENGRSQQVLQTTVKAHSVILSKRCRWLGDLIRRAREERAKNALMMTKGEITNNSHAISNLEIDGKPTIDEDDNSIEILSYQLPTDEIKESGAAEIENDDDEDDNVENHHQQAGGEWQQHENCTPRAGSPVVATTQSRSAKDELWVTLPNHSPEAVKLLLEYCYTNRVIPLGQEAFVQACRSKPHKFQGPVPPFVSSSASAKRWPSSGHPLVSFSVALAGISLAEEASMPRLSLMCEVAASQLLTSQNVVDALSMCKTQERLTGNPLPRLRKAAMDIMLRSGRRGVTELVRTNTFKKALEERSALIVPTLLVGTMEAVTSEKSHKDHQQGTKRDRNARLDMHFDDIDREESRKRHRERSKRRVERGRSDNMDVDITSFFGGTGHSQTEANDTKVPGWATEATKRSLKRMGHHNLNDFTGLEQSAREIYGRNFNFGSAQRRRDRRGGDRG